MTYLFPIVLVVVFSALAALYLLKVSPHTDASRYPTEGGDRARRITLAITLGALVLGGIILTIFLNA